MEQLWPSAKEEATRIILSIFSLGNEAWNLTESRLMPRNSMSCVGPKDFSCAMGTPSSVKILWTVVMFSAGMASGGDIMRKSSSRWIR